MPVTSRPRLAAAVLFVGLLSSLPARAADPTKDQCIDANETAQALRKSERLRDAEQRLLVCVSASCPGPVREDCGQRLTELRSVIPTVVFSVKDDADQDLSEVRVTMDDQPLASKLDGTAIAIDPGPHHFVFEAAGRQREERSLVIREGEKDRHERVVLVASPVAAPAVAAPVPESTQPAPIEVEPTRRDGKGQRVAGLVVGGVGVAGVVVGGVFGIVAKSTYNRGLGQQCTNKDPDNCTSQGVEDGKNAHTQATVSTVAFIAGGALLGAGALLYFTAPRSGVTVAPTVGLGSAGMRIGGSF
ncbi:MAG TPA: hypothetical protein VK762_36490 [Polyangiaceae bacterium]|nr:hypothetical protein [Polyangiaceae bacterium]